MISFIIVNYNSVKDLKKCLRDLENLPEAYSFEVVVVNNDKQKLSLPHYKFKRQYHCEINENVGYGAANNRGLTHVSENYVCFLNPDTYNFSDNFLDVLQFIDEKTIASPQIQTEEGAPQDWSVGERVTLLQIIKNNFNFHKKLWTKKDVTSVDWVCGAALFAQTDLIKKLGGFDEDYFLYYEDVDLCKRLTDHGGQIFYVPHIYLTHSCGKSSKNARKNQKKWYYKSQDTFFKKHVGTVHMYILRILRFFHR